MTPRVSIVTTVYDRVDCLRRCLRSVARLDYRDVEHIVVSDHPPCVEQVRAACADAHALAPHAGVRHFDLPTRHNDWGISPAMAGLRVARGEFVCFLSDDNAYLPDHFGPLVAALDAAPDVGFAYSSCLYNGRRELRYDPPLGAGIDLGQPLFRRSALACFNGDVPARVFSWDWELINALMARGVTWKHVDRATFVFRVEAYPQLVEQLS